EALTEKLASIARSPNGDGGRSMPPVDSALFDPSVSVRRALILALGEFDARELATRTRDAAVATFTEAYRDDPDSGIHSAAEWTPRRWGFAGRLPAIDDELRKSAPSRRWFVNNERQTFARIVGPVEFQMGSPTTDPDHLALEWRHLTRIDES